MQTQRYCFDLFAGCGGLTTGLEMAGFDSAMVCEVDDDARNSYLLNRKSKIGDQLFADVGELHFADVNQLNGKVLDGLKERLIALERSLDFSRDDSSLDLICGGPPCQGFSGIGIRRSYAVDKEHIPSNHLYGKMADIIEQIRPKIFMFENVKGILTGRWNPSEAKGQIWRDVKSRFQRIPGYTIKWSLVLAKDYGVPQNRPRVLLVGIRNDLAKKAGLDLIAKEEDAVKTGFLPQPVGIAPDPIDLLGDLIDESITDILLSGKYPADFSLDSYPKPAQTDFQKFLRTDHAGNIARRGSPLSEHEFSKHSKRVVQKFQAMLMNGGVIPESMKTKKFAQRLIPERWPDKGPFITATSLPDDYVHFSQPRSLSVREWARLQTFPDWYRFAGKRTTGGLRRAGNPLAGDFSRETPKYTQIGNAVPVLLAKAVGDYFNKILCEAGV